MQRQDANLRKSVPLVLVHVLHGDQLMEIHVKPLV